jgi:CRISPR/Cas system-associated protein Cas7 (RAMP superfamily)
MIPRIRAVQAISPTRMAHAHAMSLWVAVVKSGRTNITTACSLNDPATPP